METIIDQNEQKVNVPFFNVALKWGIIGALLGIVQTLFEHVIKDGKIDQNGGGIKFVIGITLAVFVIVMCIKEYRDKHNNGMVTFGRAFKVAFVTSLITVIIVAIFTFMYFSYVIDFDAMMADGILKGIADMKKKGMDEAQIQNALKMSEFTRSIGFICSMVFVFGLILDTIIALICAAVLKKEQTQYA